MDLAIVKIKVKWGKTMRVVSGTAKGRGLKAVPGRSTRPTSDKVKEAIFSRIGPFFDGGQALDLYAGTGGLGIEALSRGMEHAVFVDIEKKATDVIRENLQHAKLLEHAEVYKNDAEKAVKQLMKRGVSFDLVLIDPPYHIKNMDGLLAQMQANGLLNPQADIVVEHDAAHVYEEQIGEVKQVKRLDYKDTAVTYYIYDPVY